MKRTMDELKRPYRAGDYRLLRAGRHGTYWQSPDGPSVQLAAPDGERPAERASVSAFAMVFAVFANAGRK
jgi:hypothetical protein